MKTILFPYTQTVVGGSYVSSSLLVRHIHGLPDWNVRVCLPYQGANASLFEFDGFTADYLDPEYTGEPRLRRKSLSYRLSAHLRAYRQIVSYLRDHAPDLLHVNDTTSQLIWGLAAKRLKIPVVWHVRIANRNRKDPYCVRFADYLILVSDAVRNRFAGYKRLPPHETIYDAVASDLETFRPPRDRERSKEELGLKPERLTLGFVGNLHTRKRPEWAVKVAIDLLRRGLDLELVVVGEDRKGEYRSRLGKMAEEAGFADYIHLLGYRDDVPKIMRAVDILLLTSVEQGEGLARVIIEAMASGVAVVSTRTAGVSETLTDGVSGLIADPNDYNDFLKAVHRLAEDPDLRKSMTEEAHRKVRSCFSIERNVEQVLTVYEKVLSVKATR